MGMELAICYRMIEARSGSMTAENIPDKGAKITPTLPIEINKATGN